MIEARAVAAGHDACDTSWKDDVMMSEKVAGVP